MIMRVVITSHTTMSRMFPSKSMVCIDLSRLTRITFMFMVVDETITLRIVMSMNLRLFMCPRLLLPLRVGLMYSCARHGIHIPGKL